MTGTNTMSAPVTDPQAPAGDIPEGTVPITLPIMVVEGMETSDGRYIEPGGLSFRDLPIPLYAKTRNTHGSDGDTATWHVGSITSAERIPGPDAKGYSGKTLPEGTFVWAGTGWMYTDVPASPEKSAYQLVRDGALRGNSVDMSGVVAEYQGPDGELADEVTYARISMQSGDVAATTLVGIPAFADAYIELDGATLEPPAHPDSTLVASAMWLSAELGDECSPCSAGEEVLTAAVPEGDDFDPPERDYSTSGMVALVPANPNMLIVPGGDTAPEMHLTLAYLGDRIDEWSPEQVAAVHTVARRLTDPAYAEEMRRAEAEAAGQSLDEYGTPYVSDAQKGPLTGNIFAHAVFNPNGDTDAGAATVYLLDGSGQRADIEYLASSVQMDTERQVGDVLFPKQYYPFVPHVTAGYGVPVDQLTYTGPVTFDRIRVAIGDDVVDYPLGGGEIALVASAATLPPVEWFEDPKLSEPTALTVTDDGRVYGHIASWSTCHIGFPGKCVTPPHSLTDYAYYKVHTTRALGADGEPVTVPVGYGTLSLTRAQGGHASTALSAQETAAHYDNTCTAAFELNVGEDEHGIWCAGRLIPGLDEATEHKARGAVFSGDWRNIRGNLELVAALAVNTPGFPVPRARVASGEPMALTAAGVIVAGQEKITDGPFPNTDVLAVNAEEFRTVMAWVNAQRLNAEQQNAMAALDGVLSHVAPEDAIDTLAHIDAELTLALDGDHPWFDPELTDHTYPGREGTVGPFGAEGSEPHVYARDIHSGAGNCTCGSALGAAVHVEAAPGVPVPDSMRIEGLTAAGKGKLHLPPYIRRISKHLEKEGMSKSHAIASAVNAAKKMCTTGDLNFPGSQQVNPGSKAQACAAVAQWKKDRPGAK